jgi:hypothetical protein
MEKYVAPRSDPGENRKRNSLRSLWLSPFVATFYYEINY